jgi:hypothetical protein
MRFAEYGREGQHQDLFAAIVTDVQDPAAPIFQVGRHDERLHDKGGMITCLSQVNYSGTALVDQDAIDVGAMEINLSHVPSPAKAKCRLYG